MYICGLPNPKTHNYGIRLKNYKWLTTQKSKEKKKDKFEIKDFAALKCAEFCSFPVYPIKKEKASA